MNPLALSLLLLAQAGDRPSAEEIWPAWRGPTQDSVSPSARLPLRWSATEHIVWKAAVPGQGNSTPAIWQDAIFVTAEQQGKLLLLRFDRKSGKALWQREVGQGTPRRKGPVGDNRFHDENNLASPSPVTDGRHVWAHFGNGDLACYDFAGERVWAINLRKEHGVYSIWWGHANSPVLAGDLIISACMQDPKDGGKSYVVAHDKRTGKEKWFVKRDTGATEEPADSYTTPIVVERGGRTELLVFGGNVLNSYDPASGKPFWECKAFNGNRNISGPTVSGDTIYAVQGMNGPLFAVRGGGTGDVTTSHVRWKFAGATPDAASPVTAKGLVFIASNDGVATCIDAASGKQVWKQRLAERFRATPLVVGDKIYFFAKEGKAIIVDAAREFHVVAENEVGEDMIASPAVAGGDLFLRTRGHLLRVGSKERE
jgi:outer membrane protein assembly factor BamB